MSFETERTAMIPIPAEVLRVYSRFRPTPLFRASRFEHGLGTTCQILIKDESATPTGNHKPEFRSWGRLHGEFLSVFAFTLQATDATSSKLRCRKLRHVPAMGCAVASRPKKTTNGEPNGGLRDRVEPRRETLERATWRAGDRWTGRQRAEIPRAD